MARETKDSKERRSTNIIAVDRAIDVLELLYREDRPMGVNEMAAVMGEHQSTIHRVLNTLKDRGYVYQNTETSKYDLSYKLFMLGKRVETRSALINIVKPYAQKIARQFKETVNVAVRDMSRTDSYYALTIWQERGGNRSLSVTESVVGQTYECFYSGLGKALLAHSEDYDPVKMRSIEIKGFSPNSITDNEAFMREIEKIREQGYAIDNEENELGLYCVACPVLNRNGQAVLAISVSGYKGHVAELGVENIYKTLREACDEISKQLI